MGDTDRLETRRKVFGRIVEQGPEASGSVSVKPGRASRFCLPRSKEISILPTWPQVFNFFDTPPVIELSPGQLSSDAGLSSFRGTVPSAYRPCTRSARG
jgi:hypothetical protein